MNALIAVDLQNDFMPGGPLSVPEGNHIVPLANALTRRFDLAVATQDWHPANHGSFAENHPGRKPGDIIELYGVPQVLWPAHCVQGTVGAEFHEDFDVRRVDRIFRKGTDPEIDSYSAFFDNQHLRSTGLAAYLRDKGVTNLYFCGLATDYCIKYSVLDAEHLGFYAHVVVDACRGVELRPGDTAQAIRDMHATGAEILSISALVMPMAA